MTVELGSWYIHLIYAAVFAFIAVAWFIVAQRKTQEYKREVRSKIKAVIKRETGFPLKKVVKPFIDGWVRVDKGDYKLPDDKKQKEAFEALTDDEKHLLVGDRKTIPSAMEWDFYPDKPFPGAERVPIRVQEWYENDPRPITWLRDREPEVTSGTAQAHTRQLDALVAGVRVQELESKSRQMLDAFNKMADKNFLYILLIVNIVIGVIALIKGLGINIGG